LPAAVVVGGGLRPPQSAVDTNFCPLGSACGPVVSQFFWLVSNFKIGPASSKTLASPISTRVLKFWGVLKSLPTDRA